ncbi:DUF4350 domain-containing protein [Fulvivirga sp.]|uniref:DUF4350 domain-containing protein n=1 Tax=Fulvivirga sp. TaxID=1931237 RepID=UPI0032EF32C3
MKGERKYIFILVGIALLYLIAEIASPKKINWTVTLNENDKNPFGSYLIMERLPDLFDNVEHSYLTIYELADSLAGNLFILSESFSPSDEDTKSLLKFISKGNNAFVSSEYFGKSKLLDTLDLTVKNLIFDQNIINGLTMADTLLVNFTNSQLRHNAGYPYEKSTISNYFEELGSSVVVGQLTTDEPVLIKLKIGEGHLYLSTTPLAFTNNYLLIEDNNEFVSKAMSYLPNEKLHWTAYYQTGRLESQTPLRYILSNDSLSITYYLVIISLLLFIVFEVKRRQRIIPIIEPPKNTTLEFVGTLGNLYYQNSNHKNIAEKRIAFFTEKVRSNYYMKNKDWSEEFMNEVAQKTGNDIGLTKALFAQISKIRNSSSVDERDLNELSKNLDNFKFN